MLLGFWLADAGGVQVWHLLFPLAGDFGAKLGESVRRQALKQKYEQALLDKVMR